MPELVRHSNRRWTIGVCLLLAVLLACAPGLIAQGADQPETPAAAEEAVQLFPVPLDQVVGRRVVRVTFKRLDGEVVINSPPGAVRRSELMRTVRAQRGLPLREGDLEADIRELTQERFWFTNVRVEVEAEGPGEGAPLRVTYLCEDPRIASISARALVAGWFEEAPPDDRFAVRAALTRQEGDRYSIESMDRELRERLFATDGRYVDVREDRKYEADGVHVTITVVPAQLVDRMILTGVFRGNQKELVEAAGLETRSHAGIATVRTVRELIERDYRLMGHAFCEVSHQVLLVPAPVSVVRLRAEYPNLTPEAMQSLIDQSRGGETVLLFQVHEGPHVKVGDYEFHGLDRLVEIPGSDALEPGALPTSFWPAWYALPWAERADRVKRGLTGKLQFGPSTFSPSPNYVLEHALQDASFLRSHLRAAGWLEAEVTFTGPRYNEDRSRVTLTYSIDPGPLYLVTMVAIKVVTLPKPNDPRGAEAPPVPVAVPLEELWEQVPYTGRPLTNDEAAARAGAGYAALELGVPTTYSEARWLGDVTDPTKPAVERAIRAKFGAQGYSNLRFQLEPQFFGADQQIAGVPPELLKQPAGVRPVVLRVDINQGHRYRINEIIIRGNTETKTSVIRRNLGLYPGEVFDIEEMRRSGDRLRMLSWFDATGPGRGVSIQQVFRTERSDPESEFYDADIIVEVVEGQTGAANFAASFAPGVGFALSLSVTKRNFDIANWSDFTGAGQSVSLELEPPVGRRQRYSLTFSEPFLFGYPLRGSFQVSIMEQRFDSFTRGERGGRIALGYTLFRDFLLLGSYQNFRNEISEVSEAAAFELRRETGVTRFAAVSLLGRYSTLNREIFPSAGYMASLEGLVAGRPFGGNVNLWRLTSEFTKAWLVTQFDETRDVSFNIHALAVYQQPWGQSDRIPLSQRMFLGSIGQVTGTNTPTLMRGFAQSGVGPSAQGDAIGGNFMVNATAQLNIEIMPDFFWIVGFIDAGELVPELENFDPRGLSVGGGWGMRIRLPMFPQPFGLDFGWPLYDQPGNRRQVVAINLQLAF